MTNAVLKVSAICHVLCIVAFRLHLMERRRAACRDLPCHVVLSVCLSGMERDAAARSLGRCRCRLARSLARSLLSRHEAARPTDRPTDRALGSHFEGQREKRKRVENGICCQE